MLLCFHGGFINRKKKKRKESAELRDEEEEEGVGGWVADCRAQAAY